MRVPLSWLRQFLATDAEPRAIADALTMAGIEVETIDDPARALGDATVARIVAAEPHPNADRLKLCQVDTVNGQQPIICGAPNARAGITVIYVPPGAHLPGLDAPLDKKPRQIRGVHSHGMVCSARELAIGHDHDGIVEINSNHSVGTPAAIALEIDDQVLDIEITPNRGDLLGIVGIARDLAATGIGRFSDSPLPQTDSSFACPISIDIEAAHMCPAFAGRLIRGVKNCPSPHWLQRRLRASGSTPRSMLVDVTNYLSVERARPLHVYDADTLSGRTIRARAGRTGETCHALDGKHYDVASQDCVIADDSGAIGLGGVMGGLATAVGDSTVNLFIESAWFDPVTIALTGRRHGIDSEARRRFERGVDPGALIEGIERATEMIVSVCGGEASDIVMAGEPPSATKKVSFDSADVVRLTGVTVTPDRMRQIIHALGMDCAAADSRVWSITTPSWRPDLEQSADIVEEIIRIEGFERIAPTPCAAAPHAMPVSPGGVARRCLAARGFTEAVTWSFMEQAKAALFVPELSPTRVVTNPVAGLDYMRPTILANLAEATQRNINHGASEVRLFEAGPVYPAADAQQDCVSAVVRPCAQRHWAGELPAYDVFSIKADLHDVLAQTGFDPGRFMLGDAPGDHWHPGRSATACLGPHRIAEFGQIHPDILDRLGVDGPLFALEITMSSLPGSGSGRGLWRWRSLTPIVRDFAFEVSQETPAGDIVRAVTSSDRKFINRVHVFDVYSGSGVDAANKSVAVEVVIQPDRTALTDEAIEALSRKIVTAVTKRTGGRLRSQHGSG